jgi:hypothetical protein
MSFWVLSHSRQQVLSKTTVQQVTNLEVQLEENKERCNNFNTCIAERIGEIDLIPRHEDGQIRIPDGLDDPDFNREIVEELDAQ